MDTLLKLYARSSTLRKGQSMTEYALIMGAIAVACIIAYNTMGTDINNLVGTVNTQLTTAAG
ncbi:MAG: Flp family type IVb pilin [Candidatus Binataceae bacterium]